MAVSGAEGRRLARRFLALALLVLLIAAGVVGDRLGRRWRPLLEPGATVVLYFGAPGGMYLVPEVRRVPPERANPEGALQELLRGPAPGSGLEPVVSPGTRLLSFRQEGTVAVANFSREIRGPVSQGSAGEIMTVYAIVNTLTRWPGIRAVRFLVEGERVTSLTGHLDLTEPVARDERWLQRS